MTLNNIFKYVTGVVRVRGASGDIVEVTPEGALIIEQQREMYSLQRMILRELQIMNHHLSMMTDVESEEFE